MEDNTYDPYKIILRLIPISYYDREWRQIIVIPLNGHRQVPFTIQVREDVDTH